MRIIYIILLALIANTSCPEAVRAVTEHDVALTLKRLDDELERQGGYINAREASIDSLRNILSSAQLPDTARLSLMLRIGDGYNTFRTDSALLFYHRGFVLASSLGLDSVKARFALRRATFLPLNVFINEGLQLMDSLEHSSIPPGLKHELLDGKRQMYFYISRFFADQPTIFNRYRDLEREAQKGLIESLPPTSPIYKLTLGESYLYDNELNASRAVIEDLIDGVGEDTPIYARACHLLSEIAEAKGDTLGNIYYLTLSAIADTRCATREVASLQELGHALYLRNDISRAHAYLTLALKNAVDCHVALRVLETSNSIPYIENAHLAEMDASRSRIYIIMVAMALLLLVLLLTVLLVRKKNSQLHGMALRLEEAGRTKDVYISQFLNLCSIYMDKLSQLNKVVNRKLTAGKVDDLLKLTKSGKFVEEQSKEFYDVFDDAFLHIYPTFVEDVNNLLQPDKRIVLRPGEKLNTDLRILAFMRMGIEETARVAQMLNYSVYTIYTYRNKFKSRALNRDTFECEVMKIKSIS